MDQRSGIERLNAVPPDEIKQQFLNCCGSQNWARQMTQKRPFASLEQLLKTADDAWWSLDQADWLEAFSSHPKIGERKAATHVGAAAQHWSEQEQSSVASAAADTREELADLNKAYERKFGYIYIVCASGKSSEEMLAILKGRIDNAPSEELRIAAAQQAQITKLRLQKLVEQ